MVSIPKFRQHADSLALSLGYQLVRFIDHGSFKETYEAVQRTGERVALKVMDPAKCNLWRNNREITAMQRCNHESIGSLIKSGQFDTGNGKFFYYAVEEFLDGGSLADKIQDSYLALPCSIELGCHLAKAIEHLASLGLVHRDIKPKNIMFRQSSGVPIIVDFGIVRDLSKESLTQSWCPQGPCTPFFAAPEQLNNNKALIDWRTDQFALGIVICLSITGKHPYQQEQCSSKPDVIECVAQRIGPAAWFDKFARKNSMEFLTKMLHPWPNRRFTIPSDLVAAFAKRD